VIRADRSKDLADEIVLSEAGGWTHHLSVTEALRLASDILKVVAEIDGPPAFASSGHSATWPGGKATLSFVGPPDGPVTPPAPGDLWPADTEASCVEYERKVLAGEVPRQTLAQALESAAPGELEDGPPMTLAEAVDDSTGYDEYDEPLHKTTYFED
jgi:hypothetical protein